MADVRWTGEATAVAQVDTFTPGGTIEADDIFILTITGWDGTSTAISAAAGGTTADNTTNLTLTADTAGEAFSVAATTTEAGGGAADAQTFVKASTTASAGPKHWDSTGNWDGGALPGASAGDEVYVEDAADDIIYGLDQSGIANTLTSLNISKSFTGVIGYDGSGGYSGTYLQIKSTLVDIGYYYKPGTPAGSDLIMIDTGTTASTISISDSAALGGAQNPPIRIKATSASTTIQVNKGHVGIALGTGESSTIGSLLMSYVSTVDTDARVYIGDDVTVTTITKDGGILYTGSSATTVTNGRGSFTTWGSAAFLTINIRGGYGYMYSDGEITTLNVTGGVSKMRGTGTITTANLIKGSLSLRESLDSRTITTLKLDRDMIFEYDPSTITLDNDIQPYDTTRNIRIMTMAPV